MTWEEHVDGDCEEHDKKMMKKDSMKEEMDGKEESHGNVI